VVERCVQPRDRASQVQQKDTLHIAALICTYNIKTGGKSLPTTVFSAGVLATAAATMHP